MRLFLKLRSAYFHWYGYNLDTSRIGPVRKESNAVFSALDEHGKPYLIEQVPGCEGKGDPQLIITLHPWPDPAQAQLALYLATGQLEDAVVKGDLAARTILARCWRYIVEKCLPPDPQTQFDAYKNLYGTGRVMDALNRHGPFAGVLLQPPLLTLLDEALGQPAAKELAA